MNKFLLLLFGLFASPFIFSQILTVNSESSVSIASGSSITLDGLEIAPSDIYVINGANDVSRSATAVTAGGMHLGQKLFGRRINQSILLMGLKRKLHGDKISVLAFNIPAMLSDWLTICLFDQFVSFK